MSLERPMTERQLWIGLVRLTLTFTAALIGIAVLLELVFRASEEVRSISITAFSLAVAVSILLHGILAFLRIIDWFEARRLKRVSNNG